MARQTNKKFSAVTKKKSINNKFVGFLFIGFSILIIIFSIMDSKESKNIKTSILDMGSYIISSLAIPVSSLSRAVDSLENVYYVFSENEKLKKQISKIKVLENELILLEHENKILKNVLKIDSNLFYRYKTAKVLVGIKSSFVKTLVILAGKKHDVKEGYTVTSRNDLLGYIYEAGKSTSRVLLITDINSRIPVTVANKNYRLILSGNNSNYLRILDLGDVNKIEEGDKLITSGDGGLFPQGISVGVVLEKDNNFIVKPNMLLRKLDYVRVINWSPEQLAKLPIKDVDNLPIFYE